MVGEITNRLSNSSAKDSSKTSQNPSRLDGLLHNAELDLDPLKHIHQLDQSFFDSKGQNLILKIEIPDRSIIRERFPGIKDEVIHKYIISRATKMAKTIDDIEKRGIMRQVLFDNEKSLGVSLVFSTISKSDQFIQVN